MPILIGVEEKKQSNHLSPYLVMRLEHFTFGDNSMNCIEKIVKDYHSRNRVYCGERHMIPRDMPIEFTPAAKEWEERQSKIAWKKLLKEWR